ncbi:unnamed protein product [Orchesella dallaii]|uniref:Uncharacterized protein n=1 Tax=Orchesella dallaii TaxID=48710 RepID=A0ABP1S0A9_9HEXA
MTPQRRLHLHSPPPLPLTQPQIRTPNVAPDWSGPLSRRGIHDPSPTMYKIKLRSRHQRRLEGSYQWKDFIILSYYCFATQGNCDDDPANVIKEFRCGVDTWFEDTMGFLGCLIRNLQVDAYQFNQEGCCANSKRDQNLLKLMTRRRRMSTHTQINAK